MRLRGPGCLLAAALAAASCGAVLIAHAGNPPQARSIRVKLVGQALIKHDLRKTVPASFAEAREYLSGADVVFTNLETAVAPPGADVKPRSATASITKP